MASLRGGGGVESGAAKAASFGGQSGGEEKAAHMETSRCLHTVFLESSASY